MSAYDTVFNALQADAVVALVPSSRIQRYYVREDVELPAISYRRNGTRYHETIHGPAEAADVTFAIVCVGRSEEEIEAIGNAVEQVGPPLRAIDREDEADPDTQIFATVITVEVLTTF